MSRWGMFDIQVQQERKKVRDYGIEQIENFPGMSPQSYKAQALRELAKRLELCETVRELCAEINRLLDRVGYLEEQVSDSNGKQVLRD